MISRRPARACRSNRQTSSLRMLLYRERSGTGQNCPTGGLPVRSSISRRNSVFIRPSSQGGFGGNAAITGSSRSWLAVARCDGCSEGKEEAIRNESTSGRMTDRCRRSRNGFGLRPCKSTLDTSRTDSRFVGFPEFVGFVEFVGSAGSSRGQAPLGACPLGNERSTRI